MLNGRKHGAQSDQHLLRFLTRSRLDLLDHLLPIAAHPGRTLQTIQNVGTIRALQVADGRDHLFLVVTRLRPWTARRLTDERRAARRLSTGWRLADGVGHAVEDLGVRPDRLSRATG